MNNKPHIFWGKSSINDRKIQWLKRNGTTEIFVLDYNQSKILMVENEVYYLSTRGFYMLFKYAPETFHHFYIPPRSKRKK